MGFPFSFLLLGYGFVFWRIDVLFQKMAEWTFQISAFFRGNQVAGSRHGFADNSIDAARQLCLKRALLVRIDPEENQRLEDDFPIGARPILKGRAVRFREV